MSEPILRNLEAWKVEKRPWSGSEEEFEAEVVKTHFNETLEDFCARVSGLIKGEERCGSNTDLALYTLIRAFIDHRIFR